MVRMSVYLIDKDENDADIPLSQRCWRPTIAFHYGDNEEDSAVDRESSIDFPAFGEAFEWLFHELALARLEMDFADPKSALASTFPQRVPSLFLPTDSGVRQVFACVTFIEAQVSDRAFESWMWFVDVHFDGEQATTLDGSFALASDVADAFRSLCNRMEIALPNSTSTSLTYPRSETVLTGDGLNQALAELPEDLGVLESETIFEDEEALEEHFAKNPEQLYDGFWLVGRQLSAGTKRADLVGIDDRGALVAVELKHGMPDRDALAQVIEYAGFLSPMPFEDLSQHLASRSTSSRFEPIADFAAEYRERYGPPPSAGIPVRPALVSTSLDEYAAKSIAYLRSSGVPLDFFLVNTAEGPSGHAIVIQRNPSLVLPKRWYVPPDLSRRERTDWILNEASQLDIGLLYRRFYDVICECLQSNSSWVPRERPDSLGLCRSLNRRRSGGGTSPRECLVMRIYGHRPDQVLLFFYDELIDLAPRKTKAFLRLVGGQPDGIPGKTNGYSFWMTEADWEQHGDEFRDLLAYMGKRWREKIGK